VRFSGARDLLCGLDASSRADRARYVRDPEPGLDGRIFCREVRGIRGCGGLLREARQRRRSRHAFRLTPQYIAPAKSRPSARLGRFPTSGHSDFLTRVPAESTLAAVAGQVGSMSAREIDSATVTRPRRGVLRDRTRPEYRRSGAIQQCAARPTHLPRRSSEIQRAVLECVACELPDEITHFLARTHLVFEQDLAAAPRDARAAPPQAQSGDNAAIPPLTH